MKFASTIYQMNSSINQPKLIFIIVAISASLIPCLTAQAMQALQTGAAKTQDAPVANQAEWSTFSPSAAGASFQMPSKPRYVERIFTPIKDRPPIKVHLHQTVVDQGNTAYLFVYNDLHEAPEDQKTIDKVLDGAVKGSVVNVGGQLLSEPFVFELKPFHGRQFTCRYVQGEKRFIAIARVYLVGKRQYQCTFMMLESSFDENLASKYLNSFKLVEPENDEPPVPRAKS